MRAPNSGLTELLEAHRQMLEGMIRREAGALLLRFDTPEDLVQGVMHEAVRALPNLEWQGEEAFRAWLVTIARRHVAGRRDYWFACKRNSGEILRLTLSTAFGGNERSELADSSAGPSTFANRREQLVLVTRAMAMLLPRDRDLVSWSASGIELAQIATWLDLTPEGADQARRRALDRLRKAFVLASRAPRARPV